MENIQIITLDIMNQKYSDYIYAKQFDRQREIRWYVTDNGEPADIGVMAATFVMKTTDGHAVYGVPDKSQDNRYFYMRLEAKHTAVPGKIPYQLMISNTLPTRNPDQSWNWDGVSKIFGTITSFMIVEPCPANQSDIEYEYDSMADTIIQKLDAAGEIYNNAQVLWNDLKSSSQFVVDENEPEAITIGAQDFWIQPYN